MNVQVRGQVLNQSREVVFGEVEALLCINRPGPNSIGRWHGRLTIIQGNGDPFDAATLACDDGKSGTIVIESFNFGDTTLDFVGSGRPPID